MKNLLSAIVLLLFTSACGNRQTNPSTSDCNDASNEVAFEVAKNYFYKNNPKGLPACPKITSDEVFNALFGMATTMGENGKPTEIDFTKQFVLAVVLSATDVETEVNPIKVEERGDSLLYTFEVKKGEKLTYSIKPLSIIILDKRDVLLNASVQEITGKLYFDYGTVLNPDSLYSEQVPGGFIQVYPNASGEESKINIEALFNTVHKHKETIKGIFSHE